MANPKPYSMTSSRGGHGHRSIAEHRWWKTYWQARPVQIERAFDIDSFNVDDLPQFARLKVRQGWEAYLKDEGNLCNVTMCTEFIASLLPVDNEPYSYASYIRNKPVLLNPNTLGAVMGVNPLNEGEFVIPFTEPPAEPSPDQLATFLANRPIPWPINHQGNLSLFDRGLLHKDNQVLWLLVCNCLMPTHHHMKLNLTHARLMYAIENRQTICLVRFFVDQIASNYESTNMKDAIKMGVLITKLCEEAGVEAKLTDAKTYQKSSVDNRTQNRAKGQLKNRPQDASDTGVGPDVVGPDGDPIAPEAGQAGEGSSQPGGSQMPKQKRKGASGPIPLDMDAITTRLDDMHNMYQAQFTSLSDEGIRFRDQYNTDMDTLRTDVMTIRNQQTMMANRIGFIEGRMGTLSEDMVHGFENIGEQLADILSRLPAPPAPPPPPGN